MRNYKFFIAFIIFSVQLLSQTHYIKNYNTESGLVDPAISALAQDSLGRIWIGTSEGLSIYNGNTFTNYTEKNGLSNFYINCFLALSQNIMLVGTMKGGVDVFLHIPFKRDTVISVINSKKFLTGKEINSIYQDSYNNIWICSDSGITKWTIKNNNIVSIKNFSNRILPGKSAVSSVIENGKGNLIFGTSKGLIKFTGKKFSIIPSNIFPHIQINSLFIDSKKKLWICSVKGLFYSKYSDVKYIKFKKLLYPPDASFITGNNNGTFWITYFHGVVKFNENNDQIKNIRKFSDMYCTAALKDREDNIWIGTLVGLDKFPNNSFTYISNYHSTKGITDIYADRKGKLFITTHNGLFKINDSNIITPIYNKIFKNVYIRPIAYSNGYMWIGTNKGLYKIKNGTVKVYRTKDGLPINFVYSLAKDTSGNLWIGTDYGLAVLKNNKIISSKYYKYAEDSSFKLLKGLPIGRVSAIICDHNGSLWFGYWGSGLYQFKNGKLTKFTKDKGFYENAIRALYEDKNNNIWIGTRYDGVYEFNGKYFKHYTRQNGLQSDFVSSIIEDGQNNLWIGTARGISKYNGKYWRQFDESDGINSTGIISIAESNKSLLYFVSNEGYYIYSEPEKNSLTRHPDVYIEDVHFTNGKSLNTYYLATDNTKQLIKLSLIKKRKNNSLEYLQNSLQFEFYSDSYKNELRTKYQYKLIGYDKVWSAPTNRNYVTYTHLDPGKYAFAVKAENADELWSLKPAKFSFQILQPFWQKWWFISISIILIIALVSGVTLVIYRYRINQFIKVEKIRNKIANDLHDDIGTSLSRIAIISQIAKKEARSGSNKLLDSLEKIENSSSGLIDAMNDIVWSINPGNETLEDAILKLQNFATEMLEGKGMTVSISIPERAYKIQLPIELRRNLILIYKEMINNIARHSYAQNVNISIELENDGETKNKNGIKITMQDNGKGFYTDCEHYGNGLKNMTERAKKMSGTFKITSVEGIGTKMELFLPV